MSTRPPILRLVGIVSAALLSGPILAATVLAAEPSVVVRPGDTVSELALEHGVPIEEIVALNALADPDLILAGQRLRLVPAGADAGAGASAPTATVHVVARGENLTWIARRYGTTVAAIVTANGIANPSRIFPGQRLAIPAASPGAARAAAPRAPAIPAERAPIRQIIVEEAQRFGVPAPLALAVAWQESGWRQGVVSSAGAVGVMQLLPATGEWVGGAMLGEPVNIHDARSNVRAGVRLLAHYLARYGGSRELALAAYYQGQAGTDRHGIYPVSRGYIASILALEAAFAR
jgi:N-acetylmuramoyl-L-alanine amidase